MSEPTADRVARVLAALLEHWSQTIDRLAAQTGTEAAELDEVLAVLARHGLVAVDAGAGNVRPGPARCVSPALTSGWPIWSSWRGPVCAGWPPRAARRPT